FVRQAIAFAGVYGLARPDEVFPRALAAARAWQDVIEAALLRLEQLAGVLATVTIALADRAGAELRTLLRHLRVIDRDDDGRHANGSAHGLHGVVLWTGRQRDPFVPGYRANIPSTECRVKNAERGTA